MIRCTVILEPPVELDRGHTTLNESEKEIKPN